MDLHLLPPGLQGARYRPVNAALQGVGTALSRMDRTGLVDVHRVLFRIHELPPLERQVLLQ